MATVNLFRESTAPIQPASHKNNALDIHEFVLDAKLLRKKPVPITIGAADIIVGPKLPKNFMALALMWQVSRVEGSAATFTIEWDDGTDIVTGADANALATAIIPLQESATNVYASPKESNTAGGHVQILAVAALANARIKVQLAGIWFMEDEETPMLTAII